MTEPLQVGGRYRYGDAIWKLGAIHWMGSERTLLLVRRGQVAHIPECVFRDAAEPVDETGKA